jgi:hypothetical protein
LIFTAGRQKQLFSIGVESNYNPAKNTNMSEAATSFVQLPAEQSTQQ